MSVTNYLHPGKKLGSTYELEALVGTGQFGQVWRAKKLTPTESTTVAVKIPLDPHRGEQVLMADGQHMLGVPKHPGIVSVHWQGRVGKVWVVEMEYVNGEPLSAIMADEVRWAQVTFDEIIRWFTGIAESLSFLHQNNIAHGDIKPDNLMLDAPSGRIKITDFGTSRRLTDNLIRTFRNGGAWAYQAPEIQKANQRGAVSDLFSVGAVLYHAIAGRLPRATIHELLTSSPIVRPRQHNPSVPIQLDELVMELLRDDPHERLATAAELHKRLLGLAPVSAAQRVPAALPLPAGVGFLDRAAALLAEGKKEEARIAAAEATLHSTGLVPALELYARLSDQLGYSDDAIKAFTRLLELERTSADVRRSVEGYLADIFLRLHRYEEAEQFVETSLLSASPSAGDRFKAAVILGACTKLERAMELLEEILEFKPKHGAALEKKAWILWLQHRYEEAAEAARAALEVMPESELCLRRLVDYETLTGNQRRAEHYRQRLETLVSV